MSQNAYAIKRPAIVIGLKELHEARNDSGMRLTSSPFGGEDNVFVGNAVSWKGKNGAEFASSAPEGVVRGLEKAKSISKSCAGIKGVVTIGGRKLPKKVVCQMQKSTRKAY